MHHVARRRAVRVTTVPKVWLALRPRLLPDAALAELVMAVVHAVHVPRMHARWRRGAELLPRGAGAQQIGRVARVERQRHAS